MGPNVFWLCLGGGGTPSSYGVRPFYYIMGGGGGLRGPQVTPFSDPSATLRVAAVPPEAPGFLGLAPSPPSAEGDVTLVGTSMTCVCVAAPQKRAKSDALRPVHQGSVHGLAGDHSGSQGCTRKYSARGADVSETWTAARASPFSALHSSDKWQMLLRPAIRPTILHFNTHPMCSVASLSTQSDEGPK